MKCTFLRRLKTKGVPHHQYSSHFYQTTDANKDSISKPQPFEMWSMFQKQEIGI